MWLRIIGNSGTARAKSATFWHLRKRDHDIQGRTPCRTKTFAPARKVALARIPLALPVVHRRVGTPVTLCGCPESGWAGGL